MAEYGPPTRTHLLRFPENVSPSSPLEMVIPPPMTSTCTLGLLTPRLSPSKIENGVNGIREDYGEIAYPECLVSNCSLQDRAAQ